MPTIPTSLYGADPAVRERLVRNLPHRSLAALNRAFPEWALPGQLAPLATASGADWRTWVIMAGRGYGKTRAGAEWVLGCVRGEATPTSSPRRRPGARPQQDMSSLRDAAFSVMGRVQRRVTLNALRRDDGEGGGEGLSELRIALVAATIDEARAIMVEGPSGLIACARPGEILDWLPSLHLLRFANGAEARLYSGASPDALRGPQHHYAWCDELAKWRHPQASWDMLQLGLRCGVQPRALVTTTPRGGCAVLARILGDPSTVQTGGSSHDNPYLPPAFGAAIEAQYGGTRMGREEIDGVLLPDVEGSLWPAALLEASRGKMPPRDSLRRVVIGVDPPATAAGTCGIVVCGMDETGVAHVLADASASGLSPESWARAVALAAEIWEADRVIAEKNMGGDMVRAVLQGSGAGGGAVTPITLVSATRGKVRRAEPVAGLFEQGRVRLAGRFAALEEELGGLVAAGGYHGPGASPDRADAMVWALTELCLKQRVVRISKP